MTAKDNEGNKGEVDVLIGSATSGDPYVNTAWAMVEHGDADISKSQFIPIVLNRHLWRTDDTLHLLTNALERHHTSKLDLIEQVTFPRNLQTDYYF